MALPINWTAVAICTCAVSVTLGLLHSGTYIDRTNRVKPDVSVSVSNSPYGIVVHAFNNTDSTIGQVNVAFDPGRAPYRFTSADHRILKNGDVTLVKFRQVPPHSGQFAQAKYE